MNDVCQGCGRRWTDILFTDSDRCCLCVLGDKGASSEVKEEAKMLLDATNDISHRYNQPYTEYEG